MNNNDIGSRTIEVGTVMVQDGTLLPGGLGLYPRIYSRLWRSFNGWESETADKKLRSVGWNFFYIAEDLRTFVFGHRPGRMRDSGWNRLLDKVRSENFNAMQITAIHTARFLGIPYTVLHSHPRHIQQGGRLGTASERMANQNQTDWANA
jgi:hypothetical protein